MAFEETLEKIQSQDVLVGVIGLGYVGLPLSIAFAEAGCRVLGFDIDVDKPEAINNGRSYLKHINADRIAAAVKGGRLDATTNFHRLDEPDVLLICVPTPLTKKFEPDLSYVESTAREITKRLRQGQVIVLESTTYPGTTTEIVKPILEKSGHTVGSDIFLAFSPEREDPGNLDFTTATIPKIVGADDDKSRVLAMAIYEVFAEQVIEVSTSATAEAVKLTENIFRSVNIALVNELKLIYGRMGIDVWEVIEAAKTKPFGYMPFYPGPGLGGHCIPIDPFYLSWKAREYGVATRFIELAGEINNQMPEHIINVLAKSLDNRSGKGLKGARILVVGLAYKRNIDDIRESPALRLMSILESRRAKVDYYDPFVQKIPMTREHKDLAGMVCIEWDMDAFASYNAVLIATDHDCVDYKSLANTASLIIDTRNVCARSGASMERVILA